MSSSRITRLKRQSLVDVFADVPDPRDARGRRYRLDVILALAAAAVLAGCQTLLAVWEHVSDLGREALSELGLGPGQQVPFESTIRRVLARIDADDFDARLASWLSLRIGQIAGRRVIAVDGKTMRGSRGQGPGVGLSIFLCKRGCHR
ncbi:MAG: transposase family protein [Propionibacteriaceae bacterium]|nr:transposase family protein [Propionibacteriaceae bacterium]